MTLITFEDGKPLFREGKVATEQACCCATTPPGPECESDEDCPEDECCEDEECVPCERDACCCVGTTAITFDQDSCLDLIELGEGEECDGTLTNKLDETESCSGATAVIEWCDLSVTLECEGENGAQQDDRLSENFPSAIPPYLCSVDGADITRQVLAAAFGSNILSLGSSSNCEFGCYVYCNRCVIRFGFAIVETPTIGAERVRYYYVTQRKGCDESPIIESIVDDGGYCCPEDAEVTITFAP